MERRNGRLLFVQKPNSYPKPYLDANWQNKVIEIMQACIPQQTLVKRRNVPNNVIHLITICNATFQGAKRAPRSELIDKCKGLHNRVVRLALM